MVRRFSYTGRWNEPWYRRMTPACKLLWEYIYDKADQAGVWEADFELASYFIGGEVTVKDLEKFGDRIKSIGKNRYWIESYIPDQYGKLSQSCAAHKPVFKLVEKYKLAFENAKIVMVDEAQMKIVSNEIPDKVAVWEAIATDARTVEEFKMAFPKKDILQAFNECWAYHSSKPSPPQEVWEWKGKLVTWLTNMKTKPNGKLTTETRASSLAQKFAERHGGGADQ